MDTIITLTMSPSLDKSMYIDKVHQDTKLRGTELLRDPGGGGINVARAVTKLGGRATALYLEGGCEGEGLTRRLKEEGVACVPIGIAATIRESLTVTERLTGNQFRFSTPGPSLSAEEMESVNRKIDELLGPDVILVASGSLPDGVPADYYRRLGVRAAARGARVIVDTSGKALEAVLNTDGEWKGPFLIKPNLRELADLTGHEALEQPDIRKAAGGASG